MPRCHFRAIRAGFQRITPDFLMGQAATPASAARIKRRHQHATAFAAAGRRRRRRFADFVDFLSRHFQFSLSSDGFLSPYHFRRRHIVLFFGYDEEDVPLAFWFSFQLIADGRHAFRRSVMSRPLSASIRHDCLITTITPTFAHAYRPPPQPIRYVR